MWKSFLQENFKAVIKWLKTIWFAAKLSARLKMIEIDSQVEAEIENERLNKPVYREYPIDTKLQTGESQKLGGAMQLTAPWYQQQQTELQDETDAST
jgi:hypothetical protein